MKLSFRVVLLNWHDNIGATHFSSILAPCAHANEDLHVSEDSYTNQRCPKWPV